MNKAALRIEFKNKRKVTEKKFIEQESDKICLEVVDFILINGYESVHVYLTQPEMMEVQTGNIIKMLWDNDVRVYTSISNFEDCSMTHYLLLPTTEVKNNRFNFPEPVNAKLVSENAFEVVLTPLLCMDLDGNRVGYGKGFYDRFFAKCDPEVIKIGLSLFEPVEKIEDVNEFDFPLDFAFTPDEFYAF